MMAGRPTRRDRIVGVDGRLEAAARRLRLALDLFRTGEELMRQRLRREYPALSSEEIETRLVEWLQERPGAEFGDAPGRHVPWPRRSP
jgi:Rv0078B-related antitoxin